MTVQELIDQLMDFPKDRVVVIAAYKFDGYDEVEKASTQEVVKVNNSSHFGTYFDADKGAMDETPIYSVLLSI
jgi:hypothetical protein